MIYLKIFFCVLLLNQSISKEIDLEYKLEQKDGKNFLVIKNSDNSEKEEKAEPVKKKKIMKRKLKTVITNDQNQNANDANRNLGVTEDILWAIENLSAGGVAGAVAGKVSNSKFKKKEKLFKRSLVQLKMKSEVQKENLENLFKVKLALKRTHSKLKSFKKDIVFRLKTKEDDIVELLSDLQV